MIESSIIVATLHSDSDAEDNSKDELDSADASGSEGLMAAFDQAAEESQSLLNRMPPAPIDTSPSTNTTQSSPNEMPLAPDRMPLTPTNMPPITNSAPLTPQAVSQAVAPALVATSLLVWLHQSLQRYQSDWLKPSSSATPPVLAYSVKPLNAVVGLTPLSTRRPTKCHGQLQRVLKHDSGHDVHDGRASSRS
ncbi:hypothetical protein PF005_g17568 [Phytophthora fragariae]|uniref:Uncharacterized protein n=1 Tax=Phytophthora fragariae TaxID=53985 RepID=A0A6A3ZVN8_9STRA|nr:hypothetical protein PF003_g38256 [Phytophthora fragariae]KAE8943750.1 hypothetical protein PF009_g6538 [Phytophthora fragariae]KAE9007637.1 hypothetical protein PF011_g11050 [Phytophthora fragariae]KAE9082866.1 hypothetical protein PF007_g22138 [Phytophthora fragariae]KAE9109551.1 hypothetical protein PF010_g11495 [Phytophthora fragariae]